MDIIEKVKEVLERETYIDQRDGDRIGYEIYVNYNEKLGGRELADISRTDNPMEALNETVSEWEINAEGYYWGELMETLRKNLDEDFDEHEDEIRDWVEENVYWYLPKSVYEQDVNVVLALDTGDANSDFTECNILNWYGTSAGYNPGGIIPELSPIRYIAESQGRMSEVERMVAEERGNVTLYYEPNYSKFTKSIRQELENSPSHMNEFVFLLSMPLNEFCHLREMIKDGKGTITVSPDTMCGLYDVWSGGGSVLEVELEKEIQIPMDKIWDAWIDCRGCRANGHGYDVDDVYGLCGYCWTQGDYKLKEAA